MFGQTPPRAIEVASIHLAEFPSQAYFEGFSSFGTCTATIPNPVGNRLEFSRVQFCGLIRAAYQLQAYRIEGVPEALKERVQSTYFNIRIQAEGDAALSPDDARVLLRRFLEERFALKIHWEKKELPAFALRVAKNGPKMPTKDLDNCDPRALITSGAVKGRATLSCKANTTMAQLADSLTLETDRPVIDQTNLTDKYVIRLNWSPNDDGTAPSIFTAVQEQLGLKLEAEKLPVDILVVDQATRPTEN